jgi:5-methylcytosine-specific restriction endonuclease McrA
MGRSSIVQPGCTVIEQAIETAAMMLGTDKSRGYCLEMICADFLAGVHHKDFRGQGGDDSEANLITLCVACHSLVHRG